MGNIAVGSPTDFSSCDFVTIDFYFGGTWVDNDGDGYSQNGPAQQWDCNDTPTTGVAWHPGAENPACGNWVNDSRKYDDYNCNGIVDDVEFSSYPLSVCPNGYSSPIIIDVNGNGLDLARVL